LTFSGSIEEIVSVLLDAGYKRLEVPLTLAGLRFDVAAVLVGTGRLSDLVIVEDTVVSSAKNIQTRIETIARAMDALESKRPITAIVIGPRPLDSVLTAISRVARILPVGSTSLHDQKDLLHSWLSVLLPLQLPSTGGELADPLSELSGQVEASNGVISELLASAPEGMMNVQGRLHEIIEQSLTLSLEEDT
jgi:hypothetical protein